MARPILATISLPALRHNYAVAKRLAPRSAILAIVKANAYGHGLDRTVRALREGCDGFGLVELEGAVAIRRSGFEGPILLLEGFFEPQELEVLAEERLATVVHDEEQLRMLETERPPPLDVFLKVNTGMNRLGFAPDKARAALGRLRESRLARSITLMTHFAASELAGGIDEPLARFEAVAEGLALPRSLANSGAIFAHPRSHADVARLGISLYGATPFPDRPARSLGVRPAMTLAARLIAVQHLSPGDCIGYGGTFRCEAPLRIGVVACGYADGYPRHAPSGTPILVEGVRTTTAGRVSMDMITVDLTPVPQAGIGSPVVLWGEGMPVDEVAAAAGTVGYELLCAVAPRVPVREAS